MLNLKDIDTVIVVGAGPAGCVVANQCASAGKIVHLFDSASQIGGACETEIIPASDGPHRVDEDTSIEDKVVVHKHGPHIFHTSDKEVWDFVCQYTDMIPFVNSPIANYNGELYNLPFNMNTFCKIFGDNLVQTPEAAKRIINQEIAEYRESHPDFDIENPKNLEEKAISMVGTTIYEKLVKGYTQKQWNTSCDQLPPSIINRLPLRFTFDNNYFNDRYQGIPDDGYTNMFINMLVNFNTRDSSNAGCINVHLDTEVTMESLKELQKNYPNSVIVYSGALDKLCNYEFGRLPFRTLKFETEIVGESQGVAVMNYTDSETPFTRITEHNLFDYRNRDKENLPIVQTAEFPDSNPDGIPYYPIDAGSLYTRYLGKLIEEFDCRFFPIGRAGSWKYMDMHIVIRSALDFCDALLNPEETEERVGEKCESTQMEQ